MAASAPLTGQRIGLPEIYLLLKHFSIKRINKNVPGTGIPLNLTLTICSIASWGVNETLNFACPSALKNVEFKMLQQKILLPVQN